MTSVFTVTEVTLSKKFLDNVYIVNVYGFISEDIIVIEKFSMSPILRVFRTSSGPPERRFGQSDHPHSGQAGLRLLLFQTDREIAVDRNENALINGHSKTIFIFCLLH